MRSNEWSRPSFWEKAAVPGGTSDVFAPWQNHDLNMSREFFDRRQGKISAKQGKKCWQQGQLGRLRFFGALPNAQLDPGGSADDLVDRGMRIGAHQENDLQKFPNVEAALPMLIL